MRGQGQAGGWLPSLRPPVRAASPRALPGPCKLTRVHAALTLHSCTGYRGRAGYSGETHFDVAVVSPRFEGLTSIKRHRLVYQLLEEELRSPVHALSLVTQTPAEAGLA